MPSQNIVFCVAVVILKASIVVVTVFKFGNEKSIEPLFAIFHWIINLMILQISAVKKNKRLWENKNKNEKNECQGSGKVIKHYHHLYQKLRSI